MATIHKKTELFEQSIQVVSEDGEKTYTLNEPVSYDVQAVMTKLVSKYGVPASYANIFPDKLMLTALHYTVASKILQLTFKITAVGPIFNDIITFGTGDYLKIGCTGNDINLVFEAALKLKAIKKKPTSKSKKTKKLKQAIIEKLKQTKKKDKKKGKKSKTKKK